MIVSFLRFTTEYVELLLIADQHITHLMIRKLIDLGDGKLFVMLVHSVSLPTAHSMLMSVACVRHMCLSPPELVRGVYCRHLCIPCTLIHAEVHTQTITTSSMQTTLLLSFWMKLITEVT